MNPQDVPLPGHLMDGLFNARVLAMIETAIDMVEQTYRPSSHPDYDPAVRDAILEASTALQALKSRVFEEPAGRYAAAWRGIN